MSLCYLQIDTVADLPVGDNLQDHIMLLPFMYSLNQSITLTVEKAESLIELAKYLTTGKGKLCYHVEGLMSLEAILKQTGVIRLPL